MRGLIANAMVGSLIGGGIGMLLHRCLCPPHTVRPGRSAVLIVIGLIAASVLGVIPGSFVAVWAWELVYPGIHWGDFGGMVPLFLTPICSFVSAIVFTIVGLRPVEALFGRSSGHSADG